MEISVAIKLIEKGIERNDIPQEWADLGAGKGLFTQAVASLLKPGSIVYAIDKDAAALKTITFIENKVELKIVVKDFSKDLAEIPELDGVLMANSLHFISDKETFLMKLKKVLKPASRIILVEYDMNKSNPWVPYPISYTSLQALAPKIGFKKLTRLGEEKSLFNKAKIYSALLSYG